jgi:type IV secretory pathway VirJ component
MASAPRADADDRAPADVAVRDLPLVEVPAASASPAPGSSDLLAVVVSGDGGWASIDRSVAGAMAARGVPVVGWNSLQYLWNGSTPDSAAHDLARVLDHYLAAWGKRRAVLVGYSLGADVLPFMVARLPAELRGRVAAVGLLAPSRAVSFEFHLSDWLGSGGGDLPVRPEIVRLRRALAPPVSILCIYGTADAADAACPGLPAGAATIVALGGGHHFGGDYAALADRVLRTASATTAAP